MRYKLQRNANGMITQCENADGGNIYAQREEINKKALENLQRPTPGKLGGLSNLQIFNFNLDNFSTGSSVGVFEDYNTSSTFPANATQTIMFGVDGLSNKALYYNILDVRVNINRNTTSSGIGINTLQDSYLEFYLLQNSSGTSSLGTKIPQPAPLSGNGGGIVDITTTGNEQGVQYISASVGQDTQSITTNSKGLRASGLALKKIYLNFSDAENTATLSLNCMVYVDVTSVSSTY
tara:strand:+ start:147 stop:854 length:708 start_codon:yes stop_codon:yes gene_type:complete